MPKPKEFSLKRETSLFRTSVNTNYKVTVLKPLLDKLAGDANWSFDLNNPQNILKVYSFPVMNNFIAKEIIKMGFECIEIQNIRTTR